MKLESNSSKFEALVPKALTTGLLLVVTTQPVFAMSLTSVSSQVNSFAEASIYKYYSPIVPHVRDFDSDNQESSLNPLNTQASASLSAYGGTVQTKTSSSVIFRNSDAGTADLFLDYFMDGPRPPQPGEEDYKYWITVGGSAYWHQLYKPTFEYRFIPQSNGKLIVDYNVNRLADSYEGADGHDEGFEVNSHLTKLGTGSFAFDLIQGLPSRLVINHLIFGTGTNVLHSIGGSNALQGSFDWRFEPFPTQPAPTPVPTPLLLPGLIGMFIKILRRNKEENTAQKEARV